MIGYLMSALLGAICAVVAIAFMMGHVSGFAEKFQKFVDLMGDDAKPTPKDDKKE